MRYETIRGKEIKNYSANDIRRMLQEKGVEEKDIEVIRVDPGLNDKEIESLDQEINDKCRETTNSGKYVIIEYFGEYGKTFKMGVQVVYRGSSIMSMSVLPEGLPSQDIGYFERGLFEMFPFFYDQKRMREENPDYKVLFQSFRKACNIAEEIADQRGTLEKILDEC